MKYRVFEHPIKPPPGPKATTFDTEDPMTSRTLTSLVPGLATQDGDRIPLGFEGPTERPTDRCVVLYEEYLLAVHHVHDLAPSGRAGLSRT